MFWPYELKAFAEQLNELNLGYNRVTPTENFSGTKIDITLKNHRELGCTVHVLYEILKGKIYGFPYWGTSSGAGIYLGHSPFCAGSVDLVLNPANGHVSLQFHVAFDY